jgi:hypothetical protein
MATAQHINANPTRYFALRTCLCSSSTKASAVLSCVVDALFLEPDADTSSEDDSNEDLALSNEDLDLSSSLPSTWILALGYMMSVMIRVGTKGKKSYVMKFSNFRIYDFF